MNTSYVPKYILKRIVPKDALKNIDLSGDGKIDGIILKYVNVLAPMEFEENLDLNDLKKQLDDAQAKIGDLDIDFKNVTIIFGEERVTYDEMEKIRGRTVPVGAAIYLYYPNEGGLPDGSYKIYLRTVYQGNVSETELERNLAGVLDKSELK